MSLKRTPKIVTDIWKILKRAVVNTVEDDLVTRGAALAFFTALSLSPLLILFLAVTGLMGDALQNQLLVEIKELVGPRAQEMIGIIVENVRSHEYAGLFSAIFGILMLIFSGTRMFVQLQGGLNFIWQVEVKPSRQVSIWFQRRLLALMVIVASGFLLLVSLIVTVVLNVLFSKSTPVWQWINFAISFFVYSGLFAMIFRILPDVSLRWRDVIPGSFFTALLFDGGKWAIGKYLGIRGVGSAYGAAGSLIILLLWVYYSSLILYFGMEIIQSYLSHMDRKIQPDLYAKWSLRRKSNRQHG